MEDKVHRGFAFLNFYFKNMHIGTVLKCLESVSPTFSCKCLFERGGTEKHCLTGLSYVQKHTAAYLISYI